MPEPPKVAEKEPIKKGILSDRFLPALSSALKAKFSEEQIKMIEAIREAIIEEGIKGTNQIAYIFATAYHESRFKPINEIRAKEGTQVWKWQNNYWPSGFWGRGPVQLTWEKNYKKFSPIVGIDLVNNPDAALIPKVGAKILVFGMAHGSFTGLGLESKNKLSTYFPDDASADFMTARKIIAGSKIFQADKVADKYLKILSVIVSVS